VSNAEEFGGWIQTVRGDTTVVVDEHRPVPLWQHVMVGKRLFDLFDYRSGTRRRTAATAGGPRTVAAHRTST
jgi:ATP-dependent RNA helicase HelY